MKLLPHAYSSSLYSTFVSVQLVGFTVKQVYTITLYPQFLTVENLPLNFSDTLLENFAPKKLFLWPCPVKKRLLRTLF